MNVSLMIPFKEVFRINSVTQGFCSLTLRRGLGFLEASPYAVTLWASKQCKWPNEYVFWRQETLTLVLDPSSEVSHQVSVSYVSHFSSEAITLMFQG